MKKLILASLVVFSLAHAEETLLEAPLVEDNLAPEVVAEESAPAPIPEIVTEAAAAEESTPVSYTTEAVPVQQSVSTTADDDRFEHRRSHWVATYGFESTKYDLPYEFDGVKRKIGPEERDLMGGRLGVGRDFYLGKGFIFGARLEGYYMGTLFTDAKTADPELSIEVAASKKTGHIFGADAVAHLGWMFDFQTKNPFLDEMNYFALELFVEAGLGRGRGYNRREYYFDASPVTNEEYDLIIEDDYFTQVVSAGVNLMSVNTGAFLYLRASQVAQDITERKFRGKVLNNGETNFTRINATVEAPDVDPISIISIGGGYRF